MSDGPTNSTYAEEAALQDGYLDDKLRYIRSREAAGDITPIEAAELRISYLEHHIETVRNLRHEWFGGGRAAPGHIAHPECGTD